MFDVSREEIVDGSLSRALLVLAGPLVVQNLAMVAQEVVDLFWVGRLGETAVAAVGLAAVFVALLSVPLLMLYTGTQVVTSRRVGADEPALAGRVPVTAAALALAVAAVLGVVVLVAARPAATLLTDDPAVAAATVQYLLAYVLALCTVGVSDSLEAGLAGWGDTRAVLGVNLVAIGVNLVADPLLILGWGPFPRLAVFGAALATGVGYGAGALAAVALFVRGRDGLVFTRESAWPDPGTARELVGVGAPVAGQHAGRQVARLAMVAVVSAVGGPAGLAAYHIGSRVATVAFVPAQGIAGAATSVVGQNLGADNPGRARRATWLAVGLAAVGLAAVGVVQWFVPAPLARLFVPGLSGTALSYAVLYLRILAVGYPALGVIYAVESGFNGAGKTDVSMYSTLAQYWLVRLPVAAVGAYALDLGVAAVFWAVTLSNVAAAAWLAAYFSYSTDLGLLERAAGEAASGVD